MASGLFRRSIGVLLAVLCLSGASVAAQVPSPVQATLLVRILSFDRALPVRAGDTVKVAVVYRDGHSGSESQQKEMVRALEAVAQKTRVANRKLEVVAVPFRDAAKFEAELTGQRILAAYLCEGLDEHLEAINRAAAAKSVLTFSGSEDQVRKGVGVGLVLRKTKAGILIHLPAARASGADLDSGLLRIAEVIR